MALQSCVSEQKYWDHDRYRKNSKLEGVKTSQLHMNYRHSR